ncbi:TolC family protein [Klebsiella sp. BIGb0407]|uniref:TolC family protein n=1 Tax=Klebsiella sp. BIGb0407 TaxID=2940603 RepID=UPI002169013B|nr:TolC family protein [Klebsiella sp. BIGb0407]MCS3430269.1 NodT family efflux transporter outer membrane factor (OMF) lipoprotein [Klebsiella sp. BIGb0407]
MKPLILFIFMGLLAGCGNLTRSEYQRPLLSVPDNWQRSEEPGRDSSETINNRWWDRFDDPRLSRVIGQVLETNNDLATAALTLKQARIAAGLAQTNISPDVSLSSTGSSSQSLKSGSSRENYSTSLSLSYELDLWGKLARVREKSEWDAISSEQDYQATILSTIDTTAQLYWNIAMLNQQVDYQKSSLEIAKLTLTQIESWQRAGKISLLDVLQSRQVVINRQNTLLKLKQQLAISRNALALLLNRPPAQHSDEAQTLDLHQQVAIDTVTPLVVLASRPDLQAAESRLRAALAGSDAARLSFYPTLSLEGTLSAGSQIFNQWFNDPLRVVGGSVGVPFIQWNTVQLTVEQASLQVQQEAVNFRRTAYTALSEVDNAMEKRLSANEQRESLQQSLLLGQQRLTLTESRYRAGAVDYQTLLNAQDALLDVQNSLAQNQYDYLYATLQLWLAQGGNNSQQRTSQNASQ